MHCRGTDCRYDKGGVRDNMQGEGEKYEEGNWEAKVGDR